MREVTTTGLDIAKAVFQAHGADASGSVVFRKKLSRSRLLTFTVAWANKTAIVWALLARGGIYRAPALAA